MAKGALPVELKPGEVLVKCLCGDYDIAVAHDAAERVRAGEGHPRHGAECVPVWVYREAMKQTKGNQ